MALFTWRSIVSPELNKTPRLRHLVTEEISKEPTVSEVSGRRSSLFLGTARK
jgi:hypothetical protein